MKSIFYFCLLSLFVACSPKNNVQQACTHQGIVKDETGLDGCRLMIYDDKGQAFMPVELPEGVVLKDQMNISFSYEEVRVMSTCMKGKSIKVTCFTEQ